MNPLWGAPRIHGELLKLGIDVGQTTVAKYMARGRRPPSQGWKTFLHNHADGIASMDIRGSDNLIPTALRAAATASRSPPNPVVGGDRAPNGRMDFAPAHRGLWLESSAAILRRWTVDSFFSVPLVRDGDTGGMRKRSWS